MKEQDNIHEELKGLSDRLSKLKTDKDPMSVPDGYFDRLEGAVFARLEAEGTRVPVADVPMGWKVWLSPARLSVAAAVATLAVAAIWWLRPQPAPVIAAVDTTLDTEITPEMAEAYIIEHIGDFEEEIEAELADQLADVPAESNTNDSPTPKPKKKSKKLDEDLEAILDDLTEEELEELL